MKSKIIILTFFCFSLLYLLPVRQCLAQTESEGITTIILVRHAEKALEISTDPPLTSKGKERAEELAYMLKHVDLDAVYSTPYIRTKQTVLPLAQEHGLEVRLYTANKGKDLLKKVLATYPGKTVLVVGHSNTINVMANILLGKECFEELDDYIYDNLFIAAIDAQGKAAITRIRFGAHTPEKR